MNASGGEVTVTVMFVDEGQLVDTYAEFLPERYGVRTALSGEEALAEVEEVDIVFLDRKMPRLSGEDRVVDGGWSGSVELYIN